MDQLLKNLFICAFSRAPQSWECPTLRGSSTKEAEQVYANVELQSCDPMIEALKTAIPTIGPPAVYRLMPASGSAQVEYIIQRDGSVADAIIIKPFEYKLWDVSVKHYYEMEVSQEWTTCFGLEMG